VKLAQGLAQMQRKTLVADLDLLHVQSDEKTLAVRLLLGAHDRTSHTDCQSGRE